jgi:pimeloyl-ACP methyl ester carboxylesterase
MDVLTDDAVGLLASLGIGRVTVLGCSMGGRIALTMALDHRGLAERLVLAATSARVPSLPFGTRRWLVMEVLSRLPAPEKIDAQPKYAWERQRQASVGFDCTDRLAEIDLPTLVIHGKGDHLVPYRLGREMAGQIPAAHLVTVAGGHQALFKGQGPRLAEEVRRFMQAT